MKPTIPAAFFDLCLIPEHDLSGRPADNILATRGMLNRIPAEQPPKRDRGLILIGGPSKHHGWNHETLIESISSIVAGHSSLDWHLADSRRTPDHFLDHLSSLDLTVHSAADKPPDWLPAELLSAKEIWVTEDSMSMIYEALTARARVGLLPMPRKSKRSRVVRGVDQLAEEGWVRFYSSGTKTDLQEPPGILHESSRCAREVLQRFPALA